MSYYRTCPHCGAHLDPGELCDCPEARQGRTVYNFLVDYKDGGKDMHTAVQIAPEPIVEAATTPETATAYIVMQYALQRKLVTAVDPCARAVMGWPSWWRFRRAGAHCRPVPGSCMWMWMN